MGLGPPPSPSEVANAVVDTTDTVVDNAANAVDQAAQDATGGGPPGGGGGGPITMVVDLGDSLVQIVDQTIGVAHDATAAATATFASTFITVAKDALAMGNLDVATKRVIDRVAAVTTAVAVAIVSIAVSACGGGKRGAGGSTTGAGGGARAGAGFAMTLGNFGLVLGRALGDLPRTPLWSAVTAFAMRAAPLGSAGDGLNRALQDAAARAGAGTGTGTTADAGAIIDSLARLLGVLQKLRGRLQASPARSTRQVVTAIAALDRLLAALLPVPPRLRGALPPRR